MEIRSRVIKKPKDTGYRLGAACCEAGTDRLDDRYTETERD